MVKIECEQPCGESLFAMDDDELVAITIEHARTDHGLTLSREQVLAMAQPVA